MLLFIYISDKEKEYPALAILSTPRHLSGQHKFEAHDSNTTSAKLLLA
jgi:hypothetical protein